MSESPAKRAKTTAEPGAVIDGKAIAASIRAEIKEASETLFREHQLKPGLAVVLVGNEQTRQLMWHEEESGSRAWISQRRHRF